LYDELERQFKDQNPLNVISKFKKFINHYKTSIYDSGDKSTYPFWYLRWAMYWKTILSTALHVEYTEFDTLVKGLKRFYYLYWIAGRTLTKIKQISFNTINWIKNHKDITFILEEMEKKLSEDGIISDVLESLSSQNVYNSPWIKPLLLMIEYNQTDGVNPPFVELNNYLHIEHVLPIKWFKYTEWTDIFTEETANKYINSIGNLTLLSGKKNIEASNNPFKTKINVYVGKGKYETKDTKITDFDITQKIVRDYDLNTYNQQWNEKSILDRWNWFCKEVSDILEIDTTTIMKDK